MYSIINDAAQAYKGIIPADRWHEPYMPASELRSEIEAGVDFVVCEVEGEIAGDGGGHFLYVTRIDTEFVAHGLFVIDSDGSATSDIVFDLSRLLVGADGRFLDPRNPDNAQLIEQAIRHATKIGMDRDHDGDPDDLVDLDD